MKSLGAFCLFVNSAADTANANADVDDDNDIVDTCANAAAAAAYTESLILIKTILYILTNATCLFHTLG